MSGMKYHVIGNAGSSPLDYNLRDILENSLPVPAVKLSETGSFGELTCTDLEKAVPGTGEFGVPQPKIISFRLNVVLRPQSCFS